MSTSWIKDVKEYVEHKIAVAKCLYDGACHGTDAEAITILSVAISAIAASAWPGEYKIDSKRFVELCVQYSEPAVEARKISIPLLLKDLHKKGEIAKLEEFKKQFPENFNRWYASLQVLTQQDDLFEEDVLRFSTISLADIRKFSYATLFYKEIRCGFIHQDEVKSQASSFPVLFPMESEDWKKGTHKRIHYRNLLDSLHSGKVICKIHFPYEWIEQLVTSIATSFEKNPANFPLKEPDTWWIEG